MKRQLNDSEKEIVKKRYRKDDGSINCFIDNQPIHDEKDIHYDHINPFIRSEDSTLENIAPVCRKHNLAKKDMTLSEYRDKLEMENIFEKIENDGLQVKLNDVLKYKLDDDFGYPVIYNINEEQNTVELSFYKDKQKLSLPDVKEYEIYYCPTTGMKYFYASVPVVNIMNDGKEESELELQPRPLILPHLWSLYRHLRVNTQLQPSICRVTNSSPVLMFDGQHKAAAKIWAGANKVEVKIYIDPELTWLMRTNLVAHDKLKQLRFYSSILADKLAQLYGANWQKYIETADKKTEKGFCHYIKYAEDKPDEKPEKQIEAFLIISIINNEENEFAQFIAPANKTGKQYSISWDSMRKYYFRYFLTRPPLTVEIDSKDDYRNLEIKNNIELLNIIAKHVLINKWNPNASNADHKKAERIFRPGSIMVWFPMLRDIIYNKLDLVNPDESKIILFRSIPDEKWQIIDQFIKKLFSHPMWVDNDANIDVVLGNKKAELTKELFKKKGFTVEWVLGLLNN
ncbi:MAG: HNH endonuclease [Ignavibacteriaceae bacterium]|nr:HNH endonuclease [Ignavibacteriaceae bacterium]